MVDGRGDGVDLDDKISPHREAIKKTEAELRQEYDVREERRRELEFLEKGGNPLDFKVGTVASVSLQSTSTNNHLQDQCLASEAKGSFILTTSPNEESAESSGRPEDCCGRGPHTADNLLLFDGEADTLDNERTDPSSTREDKHLLFEQCSWTSKDNDDLLVNRLGMKRQAYARRNRSRSSRDVAKACLVGSSQTGGPDVALNLVLGLDSKDPVSPLTEQKKDKENVTNVTCNSKSANPKCNGIMNVHDSGDVEVDLLRKASGQVVPQYATQDGKTTADYLQKSPHDEAFHDSQAAFSDDEPNTMESVSDAFVEGDDRAPCLATETTCPIPIEETTNSTSHHGVENKQSIDVGDMDEDKSCSNKNPRGVQSVSAAEGNDSSLSNETPLKESQDEAIVLDFCSNDENSKHEALDHQDKNQEPSHKHVDSAEVEVKVEEGVCDNRVDIGSNKYEELIKPQNDVVISEGNIDNQMKNNTYTKDDDSLYEVKSTTTSIPDGCSLPEGVLAQYEIPGAVTDSNGGNKELGEMASECIISEVVPTTKGVSKPAEESSMCNNVIIQRRKSHWDFVLEEMAWLANDFAQERMWKVAAAAHISRSIASGGPFKFGKLDALQEPQKIAHSLAVSVMRFWKSVRVLLNDEKLSTMLLRDRSVSSVPEITQGADAVSKKEKLLQEVVIQNWTKHMDVQDTQKRPQVPLICYAMRFLSYEDPSNLPVFAEAPTTPDRASDTVTRGNLSKDQSTEESLCYWTAPGAMDVYRRTIEQKFISNKKYRSSGARLGCEDSRTGEAVYEVKECETSGRYMSGAFEGTRPLKLGPKKRKNFTKAYVSRPFEAKGALMPPFSNSTDIKFHNQTLSLPGKRDICNPNVGSIPTKRVRTAARQRLVNPYGSAISQGGHFLGKNDVSSGDTSSIQDEVSTLHGSSQPRKSMEIDSNAEPIEAPEVSMKPKKKKAKHMGYKSSFPMNESASLFMSGKGMGPEYEQRWQLDPVNQLEQKDQSRKRAEGQQYEANVSNGVLGQHVAKRPKVPKLTDTSPEAIGPLVGSIPSPAASQMSNIATSNKLMKVIPGRDRSKKTKILKFPAGQTGGGVPWTLFEDQALVVFVHDMGLNWDLVTDAINSTLHFKCIFRKSRECRERHKILMDLSAGDGADSADDSGTSQPYPSTLHGIPKGSARQLFKRLQEPMEDDILKSHFEKIIQLGQQHQNQKLQDQEPLIPSHPSHAQAVAHLCTQNVKGGPLTPLDLCDTTLPSGDMVSAGYYAAHNSALGLPHQGVTPLQPSSTNHMLQGPSGVLVGGSLPSQILTQGQTMRDGQRYGIPKPTSLQMDEQNRMQQQCNQMIPSRNSQQLGLASSGNMTATVDRARMLPGGNGIGMMPGMHRGIAMPRGGYQGINSPGMLNMVSSGTSMLSTNSIGVPSPGNSNVGTLSSPGNPISRSREALQMMRPSQPSEDQRQMLMQEFQLQASQNNGQGIAPFSTLGAPFSPPVQSFPAQQTQSHHVLPQSRGMSSPNRSQLQGSNNNPHTQAYAMRFHQRLMQQHHPHPQSAPVVSSPHGQALPRHMISSLPNGPQQQQLQHPPSSQQQQQQNSTQGITLSPSNMQQSIASAPISTNPVPQKQPIMLAHAVPGPNQQTAGAGLPNQVLKQRQKPQMQQNAQHRQLQSQQPRQQSHAQQAKLPKGAARGNAMMQSLPTDVSYASVLPSTSGSQVPDKGDQVMHMMHGQRLFPGPASAQAQLGKQMIHPMPGQHQNQANMNSPQVPLIHSPQQKAFPRPAIPSRQSLANLPEGSNPITTGHVTGPLGHTIASSPQHMAVVTQQQANGAPMINNTSPQTSTSLQPPPQHQHPNHPTQLHPQHRHIVQQSQPAALQRRMNNRQMVSDAVLQPLLDQGSGQSGANVSHQHSPVAPPTSCTESSIIPATLPPVTVAPSQWKAEPLYDNLNTATSHVASSIAAPPLSNPSRQDPIPLSGNSPSPQKQFTSNNGVHGNDVTSQWQQQQPHSRLPPQQQVHQQ